MERRNRRNSHGSSLHETMEERSLLRECALVRFRRDEEMEAPISASQGAMRSLPGKLESLLLEPPGHRLTKGEKNKIRLLKGDLEELIANYLMEPSEVDAPALTANCWVKEVRELSYDIDDFVRELIHVDADAIIDAVQKTPCVKITRLRENLNRRRWIADEISGFRNRVKGAIKLHRNYNLGSCSFRSWRTTDEHPLPPLYARLVHMDGLRDKLHRRLTDEGEQQQRVASIVGIGGVGKTTLAKQVYDKLGGRFECRAFVRTSRKADMRRLLTSMLSQLRRHEPPEADAAWELHNLIDKIRAHLIHKKYFIIIDDLWSTSTWDIVSHALPDNPCSRILLTTEFDIVAQMCCGYNSKYIFKMEPLSENGSRELFFSRAFGHQHDCPEQLNEVSYEIIRKCGGLPLATITIASLLACQPNRIDQWKYIQNSLSSILRTDATLEWMQQVLNVSYNNLPHRLKACMLYLSMYQESHIIWKHDLVKQWIAEDFISVVEGEDMEEIAGSYFDELVKRGMIQPVDINYNGEVLSCAMHYIVHNFIRYKSIEENFVCAIDHSQTNVRLTNKVRRLSLHFGDAEDVTPPSLRLSQVRSVGFFGLFKCMPSILEFNLLQVLILQLWVDDYDMSYNFTEISKLFRLRYLRINAFHLSVQLPAQMQRLKDLVTLDIERRVTAVPSDIVDLPRLLHLSLPSETALPSSIGRMTSLRTLGYFNLSSNSKDNVLNLGELTNLCDLRLTCSTVPSVNLEDNMQCLSTILWKLSKLKSLTLAPEFSHTKTPVASVSRMSISCDGLGSVSSPPTLLQRLELLPRICIFSSLPEWIRKLDRLSILRIAVTGLSMNDIDILKGLLALTALSLYVRTAPVERIVFDKAGFPILKYLKFMCTAPCLAFEEGAMPNVRRLKLGSNAHRAEQYGPVLSSIKYLLSLEEITVLICGSERTAAKPVLWDAITKHPSTPIINIRYVDWIFYCEEEKIRATQKQEQPSSENQYENVEIDSDRQHGILEMNTGKDTTQEQEQPSLENQYENVEVDSDRQHGILEMNTGKGTAQEQEQPSLENQYENVEVDSDRQHGILEMNTGKGTAQEQEQPSLENQYENVEADSDRQHGILEMNTGKATTQEQEQPSLENQYENVEANLDRQHGILEMNTGKDTNNQADCRISMSPESSSHLPSPGMERVAATSFSKIVIAPLVKVLQDRYKMLKNLKDESEAMEAEILMLAALMDDLPPMDNRTAVAIAYSEVMRDLTHDMEDCIERFLHGVTGPRAVYQFATRIKKLRKRLDEARKGIISPPGRGQSSSTSTAAPAGAGSDPVDPHPVGIAEATEELLTRLDEVKGEPEQLRVISIVGFGGSGKTTLANAVYQKAFGFSCRAWVDRSKGKNARDLLKTIIQQVCSVDVGESDEQFLRQSLKSYLKKRRYLIVIDDIEMKQWNTIESIMENNGTSSRIIVTTTIQSIANRCSSGNGYVYKMRTLGESYSREIALPGIRSRELVHGSATLLKKCDGLPLALVSVANQLRSETELTGRLCAKLGHNLGIYLGIYLQDEPNFARLRGRLMDYYTSLPDYVVRTCLLYLGIFPHDRPLKRNVIIRRWLAEGYARRPSGSVDLEDQDVAVRIFEKFIDWDIIQPVYTSNNGVVKMCKTRGIMHEFLLQRSINEKFIMSFHAGSKEKVRHLFVHDRNDTNSTTTLNMDLSCVRSLTVLGNAGDAITDFGKYKLMRVLDLEECSDVNDSHLKDICKLWNLRYLSLGAQITMLPKKIAKLKLLETLHVSKTRVNVLPVEVIGLPCLINLIGKFKLPDQYGTVSSKLEKLSKESKLETLEGFVADGRQGFLQLMVYMKNLRKVKIWCESTGDINNLNNHLFQAIQKYTAAPMGKGDVRSLSIHFQGLPEPFLYRLRDLCNHSLSLKSLKLHGNLSTLPEFIASLCALKELCLSSAIVTRDFLETLGNMPSLLYLKLIADQIGEGFVIQVGAFQSLRRLRFVVRGPNPILPEIQDGALPELVSLQLLFEHLAGLSGIDIGRFKKLEEVALHPEVDDQTRREWEAAARNHPKRPNVLPFKRVDDPTENPVSAREEAAADQTGIQGHEGPKPSAM